MPATLSKLILSCIVLGLTTSMLLAEEPARPNRPRPQIRQGDLREGEPAPDFTLADVAGDSSITLSELQGKPVVLIFGSCTCPPFVQTTKSTEKLYAAYKDKAHVYLIYIREAHPIDGRAVSNNRFQVKSPTSLAERQKVAQEFAKELAVSIPILVDTIDDPVEQTYACWPNRMYILDAKGTIVDKGTAGPQGVNSSLQRASGVLDKLLSAAK